MYRTNAFRRVASAILLQAAFGVSAIQAQGISNCDQTSAACIVGCAKAVFSGAQAVARCKTNCDSEREACRSRESAAQPQGSTPTTNPQNQTQAAGSNSNALSSSIGPTGLELKSVLKAPNVKTFSLPTLGNIPLIDLTRNEYDVAPQIPSLTAFMSAYISQGHDWSQFVPLAPPPTSGGAGVGLLAKLVGAMRLAMDEKSLQADLTQGIHGGQFVNVFEADFLRRYFSCPPEGCTARDRSLQWKGDTEFARERSRAAFLAEAVPVFTKAFTPTSLQLQIVEQRRLRAYDFAKESFNVSPQLKTGALVAPSGAEAITPFGSFFPIVLDRKLSDELRLPKNEAEEAIGRVKPTGTGANAPRIIFSLIKLDCTVAKATRNQPVPCRVESANLYADSALTVKLGSL